MFNPKIGDHLARITPPVGSSEGYCQTGVVTEVTETTISMDVQVDMIRRMTFDRRTGFDTAGLGSFIVRPDYLGDQDAN